MSIEFNFLYRWHTTLSRDHTEWTERMFEILWPGVSPEELSIKDFVKGAAKLAAEKDAYSLTLITFMQNLSALRCLMTLVCRI